MLRTFPGVLGATLLLLLSITATSTATAQQAPPTTVRAVAAGGATAPRQHFARIRTAAGLRAARTNQAQPSRRERERAAMREITAGLEALRGLPTKVGLPRAATHFARAARHDPPGHDALFALATTIDKPLVAQLAVRSPVAARRSAGSADRAATLLLALLDRDDDRLATAAFEQLTWLLDASPTAGGILSELQRRAAVRWEGTNDELALERWNPSARRQPTAETVLPFEGPRDAVSRVVALAAVSGDGELLQRLHDSGCQARFALMCHALAAPRVDARWAQRLFDWYSGQPDKWILNRAELTDLNAWQLGVVTVLVGVLPKLPRKAIAWYESHLTDGVVGAAAAHAAQRHLYRFRSPDNQPWFGASNLRIDTLPTIELLRLWSAIGNGANEQASYRLRRATVALPQTLDSGQQANYLATLLLRLPLPKNAGDELVVIDALLYHGSDLVAITAAERATRLGPQGRTALTRWVTTTITGRAPTVDRPNLCSRAWEIALDHSLALPLVAGNRQAGQPLAELYHTAITRQASPRQHRSPPARTGAALRAWLHAARAWPQWPPIVATRIARRTASHDPLVRRAAYLALRSVGAASHAVSALASEAALDPAAIVRVTTSRQKTRHGPPER